MRRFIGEGFLGYDFAWEVAMRALIFLFALSLGVTVVDVRPLHATPYEDADAAIKRDDENRALAILAPLAERGDAEAQYRVGQIFYLLKKDDSKAVRWIRLATDQGHAGAMYVLGNMNYNGNGVPRNLVEAYRWYELAAQRAEAQRGVREMAVSNRDLVAKLMTSGQIAEAKTLAAAWAPKPGSSLPAPLAMQGKSAPNAPLPTPRAKFALPMMVSRGDLRFECPHQRHQITYLIEVLVAKSQVRHWARFDDFGRTNGPFGPYEVKITPDKLTWTSGTSASNYILDRRTGILTIETTPSDGKPFIDRSKPCLSVVGTA
jgi:hypothetical protein